MMLRKTALIYALVMTTLMSGLVSAKSKNDPIILLPIQAELFGLPLDDLSFESLEKQLEKIGIQSYPSYRKGVATYSLGSEGILGVTKAAVQFNESGYIYKTVLSGMVESNEKRKALSNLLVKKYGKPNYGFLEEGYGRVSWLFKEGTAIELRNSTFDVSITYVDERPKRTVIQGRIDVEALSRKK